MEILEKNYELLYQATTVLLNRNNYTDYTLDSNVLTLTLDKSIPKDVEFKRMYTDKFIKKEVIKQLEINNLLTPEQVIRIKKLPSNTVIFIKDNVLTYSNLVIDIVWKEELNADVDNFSVFMKLFMETDNEFFKSFKLVDMFERNRELLTNMRLKTFNYEETLDLLLQKINENARITSVGSFESQQELETKGLWYVSSINHLFDKPEVKVLLMYKVMSDIQNGQSRVATLDKVAELSDVELNVFVNHFGKHQAFVSFVNGSIDLVENPTDSNGLAIPLFKLPETNLDFDLDFDTTDGEYIQISVLFSKFVLANLGLVLDEKTTKRLLRRKYKTILDYKIKGEPDISSKLSTNKRAIASVLRLQFPDVSEDIFYSVVAEELKPTSDLFKELAPNDLELLLFKNYNQENIKPIISKLSQRIPNALALNEGIEGTESREDIMAKFIEEYNSPEYILQNLETIYLTLDAYQEQKILTKAMLTKLSNHISSQIDTYTKGVISGRSIESVKMIYRFVFTGGY